MNVITALDYLVRIAGVIALAIGLALWNGNLYSFVAVHIVSGIVVVLGLWGLALVAYRSRIRRGLATLIIFWGFATVGLGFSQTGLLIGDLHWLVQVLHLLLGLGSIALAAMLAGSLRGRPNV